MNVVIIQNEDTRITFRQDRNRYEVVTEQNGFGGSSVHISGSTRDAGNKLYAKCMKNGFKRFRDIKEVSWYATSYNNTPYKEEWRVEGNYLIPICSRGITYTEENPIWKD
jgi:hypothetical protein